MKQQNTKQNIIKNIKDIQKLSCKDSFIFIPYFWVKNETNINFNPLPKSEVNKNKRKFIERRPDAIAVILNGIGIIDAKNKIKNSPPFNFN